MQTITKKSAFKQSGATIMKKLSAFIFAVIITGSLAAVAAEAKELIPVGRAVGIRLETNGVMIAGIPDTCGDGTTPSPAKDSGLRAGDVIIKVGGREVNSGEELKKLINEHEGGELTLLVERNGNREQISVTPRKTGEGGNSIGILVRDGISGIGTVTFFDPETGKYGALGHPVSDAETGLIIPLREGHISSMSVTGVAKGKVGVPGQLHGSFDFEDKLGTVKLNTDCGIFGELTNEALLSEEAIEAAEDGEIHTGEAYILSNISGSEVEKYDIEISRVFTGDEADGRSMLITVKDDALVEATGGIVQGMSGSPIIQDGRLIGAVTHVLVNEPLKGYGISIERMLARVDA